MANFAPIESLVGGALIGLSASLFLLSHGVVAGVSGLAGDLIRPRRGDKRKTAALFISGLLTAGLVANFVRPSAFAHHPKSLALAALAGVLVGFGTTLGSGCTSGHGVCGLSRLSTRSIAATLTFMATAAITVLVSRIAGGHR